MHRRSPRWAPPIKRTFGTVTAAFRFGGHPSRGGAGTPIPTGRGSAGGGSITRSGSRARLGLLLIGLLLIGWLGPVLVTFDIGIGPSVELAVILGVLVAAALVARRDIRLHRELREAERRFIEAGDAERRRIQRDLHDGTQQRLIGVRTQLGLMADELDGPADRQKVDRIGQQVELALADIRAVATAAYPPFLDRYGVIASLRSALSYSAQPISVEAGDFGRYPEEIERAVYFSCLEAVQNASKHGGSEAHPRIRLDELDHLVVFEVDDCGVGFEPLRAGRGAGLVNMSDRVRALRGRLVVDSVPGSGTRIRGEIPVEPVIRARGSA